MAPQVWIAIILMSILFVVKLSLIIFSQWYEETQYPYGSIGEELRVLSLAIVINIFAIYGLNCSIKGGCTVYSWAIAVVLLIAMFMSIFSEIENFKTWQRFAEDCTARGGVVDTKKQFDMCVMPK